MNSSQHIIKNAQACIRKGVKLVSANIALGIAHFENGKTQDAIKYYKKALSIKCDSAEAHAGLGLCLAKEKEFADSIKHLKIALDHSPDCGLLANWIADAYFDLNDLDNAISYYSIAINIDKMDSNAHNDMADALRIKGDYQGALQLYEQTLAIDPSDTNAMLEKAQCQIMLNKTSQARQTLEELIERFPESKDRATAHAVFGALMLKEKKYTAACKHYSQAADFFPFNKSVLFQAAVTSMKTGNIKFSKQYLDRILQLDPSDKRAQSLVRKLNSND